MRLGAVLSGALDRQRGHLFPWSAVLFAIGIAVYFALPSEPGAVARGAVGLCALGLWALAVPAGSTARVLVLAAALLAAGFWAAAYRAHAVADIRLGFRFYGPIEGRIVLIDRSQSDAVRLTLDRVVLGDLTADRTPGRVRVALHGIQPVTEWRVGQVIVMTGHLAPPGGPVEPGGFDFQRQAWFQGIGAIGYTRTPALPIAPPEAGGAALWVTALRMAISDGVQARMPGRSGAFAAAVTTGDRTGMDRETLDALRATNLAHLLAISGLHMGLLTGFVFAAIRIALALIPGVALRHPTKKFAAVGALVAGAAYLALSGGNVATERAFIMVAVMFFAVLADRRAVTIRAVALAGLIVLALRPETLLGPGFQMSFAATTALVAVYGWLQDMDWSTARWPRWCAIVGGVALSSFVAGTATAPIAAAHFNQVPHYGLLANVLTVPLMGAVIIPGAVLAALLWPLGLSSAGLWLMDWPIRWTLAVADRIAAWPGALSLVPSPPAWGLPLLAVGGVVLVLWQGKGRLTGAAMIAIAIAAWGSAPRPDILISASGGLVGVMTDDGRILSKPRGDGFAAATWLENDGDGATQAEAAGRPGISESDRLRWIMTPLGPVIHATGKAASARAVADCQDALLVVVNTDVKESAADCRIYGPRSLRRTGAVAIYTRDDTLSVVAARRVQGARPWSQ